MIGHSIKVILAGRILDVLFEGGQTPGKQGMTAMGLAERLTKDAKEGKFSPRVCAYIKMASGVSPNQVAWLLRVMEDRQSIGRMNFGFVPLPIVANERRYPVDLWHLVPTFTKHKRPRRTTE